MYCEFSRVGRQKKISRPQTAIQRKSKKNTVDIAKENRAAFVSPRRKKRKNKSKKELSSKESI